MPSAFSARSASFTNGSTSARRATARRCSTRASRWARASSGRSPSSTTAQAKPFQLQHASASRVAQLLQNFYNSRYNGAGAGQPGETLQANNIRFTYDDRSNTVFVQAAPADMAEIQQLIWSLDNMTTKANNELRIFRLTQSAPDDIAVLLLRAISDGVV